MILCVCRERFHQKTETAMLKFVVISFSCATSEMEKFSDLVVTYRIVFP